MKLSKKYCRIGLALAMVAICLMMSPIPANANMTIGNRYFNHNESAITNNSFMYGLSGWTVTKGIVTSSPTDRYDEDAAIDFATGLNNDIVIEQLLDDKSTKNTGIIAFAEGKQVVFSFKFKTDYSYATARAWIGTKSYDRFGVLRWYWNACNPLPGKVTGDAAGSWVTVQYASWICPGGVYGLAVRIEILDTVYSATSSSMDNGAVLSETDPGEGGGHVNAGYVDDAQLAVAQTISTVTSTGAKIALVVMIRSVAMFSSTRDHAVIDIAFAADTSGCHSAFYGPEISCIVIEVHLHPVHWSFGYVSDQDGSVTVVEMGQSNNKDIDVKPCDDVGSAVGLQVATWALGLTVAFFLTPLTGGLSLAIGLAATVAIDTGMAYAKQGAQGSDMYANGPGRNYYTRTRLQPYQSDAIDLMTISNTIDWYYARGHTDYNLQIHGGVAGFGMAEQSITTYLYA